MGACFQEKSYPATMTPAEVNAAFETLQIDDRYENGHSYSGGFGMASGLSFTGRDFPTEDEALQWLMDYCQKWEEARAVTCTNAKGEKVWLIGAWCSS